MSQHAGAGPAEGRKILGAGRQRHRQGEGLAVGRLQKRDLSADPHRLFQRAVASQILGQRHEIERRRGEIGTGKEGPLHVGSGPAGGFQGHAEGLIHPGLRVPAGDGSRNQVGCAAEFSRIPERDRRDAQLRQSGLQLGQVGLRRSVCCRRGRDR